MSRFRAAIAQMAQSEERSARALAATTLDPCHRAGLEWVSNCLAQIEPFFLTRSDTCPDARQLCWLRAAERALTFYVTELRRLEDLLVLARETDPTKGPSHH